MTASPSNGHGAGLLVPGGLCCIPLASGYLVVFFQSSTHQGHQLLGLLCVVPFLMTLIFMVFPPSHCWLTDGHGVLARGYLRWSSGTSTNQGRTTPGSVFDGFFLRSFERILFLL